MNPLLPPEFWLPLLLGLAVLLWRSGGGHRFSRPLRLATLIAMAVLLLNPGRYIHRAEPRESTAWVLLDRSASMAVRAEGGAGGSRWEEALDLTRRLTNQAVPEIQLAAFAGDLSTVEDVQALSALQPEGETTDICAAVSGVLQTARAEARPSRGLLVLSDGISLGDDRSAEELGLTARALGIPVSVRLLGEAPRLPDLSLILPQNLYTVTAGTDQPLPGRIRSRHLPPLRTTIRLRSSDGRVLSEQTLNLPPDADTPYELRTGELTEGLHTLRLELDPVDGEARPENNFAELRVHAVELSLRVLLLEGVPHWDSKFLSQWLRQQRGIELTTLHRLSDNRWFRVNPGDAEPDTFEESLLPGEDNDFRDFDLILAGRGLDYLTTTRSTAALHAFVRDHGGMVIFTRGRPVTTPHPSLESLLPVQWLEERSSEHQAQPAPAGLRAGLYGNLLPGAGDPLWAELPSLRGLHRLRVTDAQSRVLMQASLGVEDADPWPVLISRRVGHGGVLLLNGEGMWHWDFRPPQEGEEKGYGRFWSQLLLWVAQSARFQPGQSYSLEWTPTFPAPGTEVEFSLRHRLGAAGMAEALRLRLQQVGGEVTLLPLRANANGEAGGRWTAPAAGAYAVSVSDSTDPRPLRYLIIPKPQGEMDDLLPREEPLRQIVEASGGSWLGPEDPLPDFAPPPEIAEGAGTEAVWQPHWTRAWVLLLLVAFPACDWTIRRRGGGV